MKIEAIKELLERCRAKDTHGLDIVCDLFYVDAGVCMQSDEFRRLLYSAEKEIEDLGSTVVSYPVVGITGILMIQNPS